MLVTRSVKLLHFSSSHSLKRMLGTFKLEEFKYHLLNESDGIERQYTLGKEEAIKLYTDMVNIRRMENTLATLYTSRHIRGFCHLYNGQEAICTGVINKLRPQDTVITAYRAHGFAYLMLNRDPEPLMAELVGAQEGCAKGKGGSMHVYAKQFFGGNGIVGAQIPLGTGAALAHKYLGTNGVSFTLFGDGAANQGQAFESYNIAKLWKLPVIYIIENNKYGMGTATSRASALNDFYRTCMYIPGIKVDGMDVLATSKAAEFAINFVLKDNGPIIMEMVTYRYFGHSMSDPGKSYRSREEINAVREKSDPIANFKQKIIKDTLVSNAELNKIDAEVKKRYADLTDKLLKMKQLDAKFVATDIYKKQIIDDVRGVSIFKPFKHSNMDPPS